ncbi:MAG: DUF308 domain-containing protein [Methanobrevibacter sp.]|nr:DUF308 domain-containing protein [Methanobrevibacter sp.]
MKTKFISILAMLLGLLMIVLPASGLIALGDLIGLSILLISIYLLIMGVTIIDYNKVGAILNLILGTALLILSILLIFVPSLVGFLASITLYLAGIMLIIAGLISLINNRSTKWGFYTGIIGVVLGVIYIIIGTYINNPIILGALIGIWLILGGISNILD